MAQFDVTFKAPSKLLSAEGVLAWPKTYEAIRAHCFAKASTQIFAEPVDCIPLKFPELADFVDISTTNTAAHQFAKSKELFEAHGITSQIRFDINQKGLWSGLRHVVEPCEWAYNLVTSKEHYGKYAESVKALDSYVTSRSGESINKRKTQMKKLFGGTYGAQDIPALLVKVNKINDEIETLKPGSKVNETDLMNALRGMIKKIPELKNLEQNSYNDAFNMSTYALFSLQLMDVITADDEAADGADDFGALALVERTACFKCGSANHKSLDCSQQARCAKCPNDNGTGFDPSTTHATPYHEAWTKFRAEKNASYQSYGKGGKGKGKGNGKGRGKGKGRNKNVHTTTNSNSTFLAFALEQVEYETLTINSLSQQQRDLDYTGVIFYDNCGGGHGTGRKDILSNCRPIEAWRKKLLGLEDVGGNSYHPDEEGDLLCYILDEDGNERPHSIAMPYYSQWPTNKIIVSVAVAEQQTRKLSDGTEMKTHQYDSINSCINRQDLDKNGNIIRFKLPLTIMSNTTRMIVRFAGVTNGINATLPTHSKRISASLMQQRLGYPPNDVLRSVGSGAMTGQYIIDGLREVSKLPIVEEKLRGSMTKSNRVLQNRDPAKYEDRNLYTTWYEHAAFDVHGPYSTSCSGSKYFVLCKYDTGLKAVKCCKTLVEGEAILELFFTKFGRPRHLGLDAGSSNISSNPDMISSIQQMCSRHGIAVKMAGVDAQWENGANEAAGRYIYESATAMCHGVGLPAHKFWNAAVSYKCKLDMIVSRPQLQERSIFEVHFGIKPFTQHIKRWGSPCYTNIPRDLRKAYEKAVNNDNLVSTAFARRCRRGVFLDIVDEMKPGNYWIWDLLTSKIIKSRDVLFDEEMATVTKRKDQTGWDFVLDATKCDALSPVDTEKMEEDYDEQQENAEYFFEAIEENTAQPVQEMETAHVDERTVNTEQEVRNANAQPEIVETRIPEVEDEENEQSRKYPTRERRAPQKLDIGGQYGKFADARTWQDQRDMSALSKKYMSLEDELAWLHYGDKPINLSERLCNENAESVMPTSQVPPFEGDLSDFMTWNHMGRGYCKFMHDPNLIIQLAPGEHALLCKEAVISELQSFVDVGALSEPLPLPSGCKAHRMHLLMNAKAPDAINPKGRRKCRIVVNGKTMEDCYDYDVHEIYAGVADRTTTRVAFAYANEIDAKVIRAADLKVAFLKGNLKDYEVIYTYAPDGMNIGYDNYGKKNVFRVLVPIYGMPQSAARLTQKFNEQSAKAGCYPTKSDPAFYVMKDGDDKLWFPRHVDDMNPIIATSEDIFDKFISIMKEVFEVTILSFENGDRCLGMEVDIDRVKGQITLRNTRQIEIMLEKTGFKDGLQAAKYPMKPGKGDQAEIVSDLNLDQIGGHLQFLASQARPDICVPASVLSSEKNHPNALTEENAKQTIAYLKREKHRGLRFTRNSRDGYRAKYFVDASWSELGTRRSRYGYLAIMFGGCIVYKCSIQRLVTLSTAWSETVALSEAMKHNRWLRCFLFEIGLSQDPTDMLILDPNDPVRMTLGRTIDSERQHPTLFFEDNSAAISFAESPVDKMSQKSRYIDMRDYFCRECVSRGESKVIYIPSRIQLADFLTKILPKDIFLGLRDQIMGYTTIKFLQ